MIDSIKNRTHWNMKNIKPRDIVLLGLCSQSQLNEAINIAKSLKEKSEKYEAEILEDLNKKSNKSSPKKENTEN